MRFLLLLLALLASASNSGCTTGPEPSTRVTAVLFDLSASVADDAMRARYNTIGQRVMDALAPGERLVADVISDASRRDAQLPVDGQIPALHILHDNRIAHEQQVADVRAALSTGITALLQQPGTACTDVLGAFDVVARVMASQPNPPAPHRLVVVSDMLETCAAPIGSLSAADADAFLAREIDAGRVPNLWGVEVWVAGAAASTHLAPQQLQQLEAFWIAYFNAASATLHAHRYGPTLLDW